MPRTHSLESIKLDTPHQELKELSPRLYSTYENIWKNLNFFRGKFDYGGKKITYYIVIPKVNQKIPIIIYNRGGIGNFGRIKNKHIFFILAQMASWGYVVGAVEYGDGDEYGGEDVELIRRFWSLLKQYPQADTNRTGLYGASRGGMMNYLLLQKPTFARCAVIKAGVTDQDRGYKQRPELIEIDSQYYNVKNKIERDKRSAIKWVDKISENVPILIFHGESDKKVSPLDSLEIGAELYKLGIPFGLHILHNGDHRINNRKEFVQKETKKWFDTYLKEK